MVISSIQRGRVRKNEHVLHDMLREKYRKVLAAFCMVVIIICEHGWFFHGAVFGRVVQVAGESGSEKQSEKNSVSDKKSNGPYEKKSAFVFEAATLSYKLGVVLYIQRRAAEMTGYRNFTRRSNYI